MLQLNIQSVLEVTSSGCYNETSSVLELLEMDFTTSHNENVKMTLSWALKLLRLPHKKQGSNSPLPQGHIRPYVTNLSMEYVVSPFRV